MNPIPAEAFPLLGSNQDLALAAKATVLLVAGLTAWAIARKERAAMRHLTLALTFVGLTLLPVFRVLSPAVAVPVLPVEMVVLKQKPVMESVSPEARAGGRKGFLNYAPEPASSLLPEWGTLARIVWLVGATLLLGRLGIDLWRLNGLKRGGIPAPGSIGRFRDVLAGADRPVELMVHEGVAAPITWGFFQPAILLPNDALNWEDGALRRALIHEVEHVRRGDWAMAVMARAVCAVYWFHPLAWIASRRLSLEAECACDDAVLRKEEAGDYAEQLVRLARQFTCNASEAALGMARRSDLGGRVAAILDGTRQRGAASIQSFVVAATLAILATGMLAPLQVVAQRTSDVRKAGTSGLNWELFEAAQEGGADKIRRLIAAGANVNQAFPGDGSPLIAAARQGTLEGVRALLDAGANPNLAVYGDGSPLIAGALRGDLPIVKELIARGADMDMGVRGDGSPLIMAARGGKVEMVEFLLDRGAKIELVVPGDENALIEGSASGHLTVVEALVKRGANVNARVWAEGSGRRDGEWRTPLNMAARRKHDAVVAFLKSAGAKE